MHGRPRLIARLAPPAAAALLVGGCSASVGVQAAPDAADPACAEVMVALPDDVGGEQRRTTTGQSSAAWGDPAVVLRCGVEPPPPTTDLCVPFDDVDWVLSELEGGRLYTTYGRVPAVAVSVPDDGPAPDAVLASLSQSVTRVEQTSACL